ncbi:ribonuclease H-like domain-containing protein [Pseudonocardia sp. Cha107L01]|uniref:ribonuclease H-like domain-containing protein n=1 Tax=Pseudonocardia sp. Cha107L01 TaxID=3457576 RepID=UPI00403E71D9
MNIPSVPPMDAPPPEAPKPRGETSPLTLLHVSSIWGIGPKRAKALEAAGYTQCEQLVAEDARTILANLRGATPDASHRLSVSQVRRWQEHAHAQITGSPVNLSGATAFPVQEGYIALDAEYTPSHIWLIGARVVRPNGDLRCFWWSNPAGEAAVLKDLANFLAAHSDLPIITWNGLGADLPALRKAANRAGDLQIIAQVEARHIDLFHWAQQNLRLPIPTLSLKEVSQYYGMVGTSSLTDGFAAETIHLRYEQTGDQRLKAQLIVYNSDDINKLCATVNYLRAAASGHRYGHSEAPHDVIESVLIECEPSNRPCIPDYFERAYKRILTKFGALLHTASKAL